MAYWINVLRNNSFVNPLRLLFVCKKNWSRSTSATGSYSRQVSWQAGSQAGRLTVKMLLYLEILKSIYWTKHWKFIGIQKGTV